MARILLVDDDPTILDMERLYLGEAGHQILTANSAKIAMLTLSNHDVDLVIVDVMMPEVNGFQFLNNMKNSQRLRNVPIAFLTSRKEQNDVVRAAKLGADFYLIKPIDKNDYLGKISAFFEKRKPKQRAQINLQNLFSGEAKLSFPISLVALSDLGAEILIDHELQPGQPLDLTVPIFNEIPLRNPKFKVASVSPHPDGGFSVHLEFAENNPEVIKRIQEWIGHKTRKDPALKAPK